MNEFLIKPREGVTVRDPESLAVLASKGELKPQNSYWLRRLKDGDVKILTPTEKKKKGAE